jgi:hypothetical protein
MISNIKATEGIGNSTRKKGIHKGSESIMFSVLQETQYMYPFKSSVREIVSNCLDSITERDNALKIINGEIKVEDIYIEKEGSEFSGSRFKPEYYDKKYLSDDKNVTILYIENDTATRDRIKFIDRGVGLGGTRLINYFDLGYSTKRLNKSQLGSFGLGAKSLLATGIDFYTVTSIYNGREYSFDVYKDHLISAVSKFEDEIINEEETFFKGEVDKEYTIFYRKSDKKNSVIVEAEVKRHRKMDFINSVENQLGFISNVELLMKDMLYKGEPSKRNIANEILYSSDSIIVGESNYYATPQILLRPGDSSDVLISYGPINFEELEMKKYSGNVSFIANINSVDVTPSRENVIWNSKTRNAIKEMFLTAQKTVENIIQDKIKDEKSLPDFLTLLDKFKSNNSINGLSELYKIIDISKINNNFRGFNIGEAAIQLNDDTMKKEFIFTSTQRANTYSSENVYNNTEYKSALSKDYIACLSDKNSNSNVHIYVGDTKSVGIGRYIADHNGISNTTIEVIYIKESLYNSYIDKIDDSKIGFTLLHLQSEAYKKKNWKDVLMYEVISYSERHENRRLLFEEDIDKTLMTALSKKQEEEKESGGKYMTRAERAKASGKVIGNLHSNGMYTYRNYYDEKKASEDKIIIYVSGDPNIDKLFEEGKYVKFPDAIKIVGFSMENFKRFYKVPGVKLLIDSMYTINFGQLNFTHLGKLIIDRGSKEVMLNLHNEKKSLDSFDINGFSYLNHSFKDYKLDKKDIDLTANPKIKSIREDNKKYLKKQTKQRKLESSIKYK